MTDIHAYWHEQIHRVMPDLDIRQYRLHQEGLVNDVLIVNNEWVFRFTKTEWGKELMDLEDRLMQFLQTKVTLSIPSPVKRGDGVLVYPHLKGETFLRTIWKNGDDAQQQLLADQLGQFLHELHSASTDELDWDPPLTLAPVTRETWLDIHERIVEKVYPLLLPHQMDWVARLFEPALILPDFFDFESVIIHGDLAPYHILYDASKSCLGAVIDFGIAGLGDPATDLGSLINYYGESLVKRLAGTYPNLDGLIERARFYAQAIELQWILLGVESGEDYWFTAHLGGARDIG
jgi:aminoglycoside 2''-phosphotransferase